MSEMVERIARIMARQDGMKETDDWSEWAPGALERAREIIAAMREPTEAMTKAENVHWDYSCHICGGAKEHWRIMIDSAIGPPSPSDAPG